MALEKSIQAGKIIEEHVKATLLFLVMVMLFSVAPAQNTIELKGKIYASGMDMQNALVTVEVDGESCIATKLNSNGAFRFDLPIGAIATLKVEKPGFTPKMVSIETENAMSSKKAKKRNKSISFEVELLPRSFDDDLIYAGPVGRITFIRGSGLMKVRFDHSMIDPIESELATGAVQ